MAKEVSKLYPESKEKNPNASEQTVIMKMVFKGEAIARMSDKYKTSHGVGWGTAPPQERGWWVNHQCKTRPTPAKDDMVMKYIYKGYFRLISVTLK